MHDIDFLPIEHQRMHRQERSQTVQITAVAILCAMTAVAALVQHHRRQCVQDELAVIGPAFDAALHRKKQMNELEQQWCVAKADAELYTYLRHPWPRTRLLSALTAPLPDGITLQGIQIVRDLPEAPGYKSEDAAPRFPIAAQRDLVRFRNRCDAQPTAATILGTAVDASQVYRYLHELEAGDFFGKAELDYIKHIENERAGMVQFRAILLITPGYGQPGGPRGPMEPPRRPNVAFGKSLLEKP